MRTWIVGHLHTCLLAYEIFPCVTTYMEQWQYRLSFWIDVTPVPEKGFNLDSRNSLFAQPWYLAFSSKLTQRRFPAGKFPRQFLMFLCANRRTALIRPEAHIRPRMQNAWSEVCEYARGKTDDVKQPRHLFLIIIRLSMSKTFSRCFACTLSDVRGFKKCRGRDYYLSHPNKQESASSSKQTVK